jgi:hypothetical protein
VFTWVRLSPDRIRLYASRRLADTAWGQREHREKGVPWHLDVNLDQLLVVDRPTPAEAMQWVLERWGREDAEARAEAEEQARIERFRQHAIAGMDINDPKAIIQGLPLI